MARQGKSAQKRVHDSLIWTSRGHWKGLANSGKWYQTPNGFAGLYGRRLGLLDWVGFAQRGPSGKADYFVQDITENE
jgi:hypothetical protein